MRWLLLGVMCSACAATNGTETASSSGGAVVVTPDAAVPDAAPELPCEGLPQGITQGQEVRDAGVLGTPERTLVLMGGGAEVDSASRTFVEAAGGGDVLVLRATGSVDSYTAYFSHDVGAAPAAASVTTLRVDVPEASASAGLACRVLRAESLWFAGGDQWDYAGRWSSVLHGAVAEASLHTSVGGTSAGAMVLGEHLFSAQDGSVTSSEALSNPTDAAIHVVRSPLAHPWLANTLVDTHFTQRDREGRLLTFAAHVLQQGATQVLALGLDEETALVVRNGTFEVQGVGSVWAYLVEGPGVALQAGTPLSLQGIRRLQLASGTTGNWPLQVSGGEGLEVRSGAVVLLP